MALDKLVDSNRLDAALTATANAIREKDPNAAASIPWDLDTGFASAIGDIPTGGGAEDELIARTISSYENSTVTSIGRAAFAFCESLLTVSFPACTYIGHYAFQSCSNLTTASFPACEKIEAGAFYYCSSLTTANFPACTSIGASAFYSCSNLTTASFPACTSIIGSNAFNLCYRLLSLYLMGSSVVFLSSFMTFSRTPISTYTTYTDGVYGSIYVPASLLNAYITHSQWSRFSSRFVGI